jgi:hypothetical protein
MVQLSYPFACKLKKCVHLSWLMCLLLLLSQLSLNAQQVDIQMGISKSINPSDSTNKRILENLYKFLSTKNNSASFNPYWIQDDFDQFIYPYYDIMDIEDSQFGKYYYQPHVLKIEVLENKQHLITIAFIGKDYGGNAGVTRAVYNLIAHENEQGIQFGLFTKFATQNWTVTEAAHVTYIISNYKKVNYKEIEQQSAYIDFLNKLFKQSYGFDITYYSCIDPKELFFIKGFSYYPQAQQTTSGGFAEPGNIIYSGNNSEWYPHEIFHVYSMNLFPKCHRFFDEGMATYLGGSGKYDYVWHRQKLQKFWSSNSHADLNFFLDIYQNADFEEETSIPYILAALICEHVYRTHGTQSMLSLLQPTQDIWSVLKPLGINNRNLASIITAELKKAPLLITPLQQYLTQSYNTSNQ